MKKFLVIPVVIVLVTALIFGGCKPVTEVPKEIRVGEVASLTGMIAASGIGGHWGVGTAIDDINAQGGVYVEEYGTKLPMRLIALNCESDPIKAGTLAEDLILRDKVDFQVCGMEMPVVRVPVTNVCERHKTVQITGFGPWENFIESVPGINYTWGMSFAIATPPPPGDFREGKSGYTMMSTWQSTLDTYAPQTNKRVAALAMDNLDGRGFYMAMTPVMEGWGLEVYGADRELGLVPEDTIDFTPVIREWIDNDCQILWANCPSFFYVTMARQALTQGFQPKMIIASNAAVFYQDILSWGGNLPLGVGNELFWHPSINEFSGIGGRTPETLLGAWTEDTGEPLNQWIGIGYAPVQVLIDAIERAGTLDADAVCKALEETDLMTMYHRVVFGENQFSPYPVAFGQWVPTDPPVLWKNEIVHSAHEFMPATADFIFPIPYD